MSKVTQFSDKYRKRFMKILNPKREAIKLFNKDLPQLRYMNEFKEVEKIPLINYRDYSYEINDLRYSDPQKYHNILPDNDPANKYFIYLKKKPTPIKPAEDYIMFVEETDKILKSKDNEIEKNKNIVNTYHEYIYNQIPLIEEKNKKDLEHLERCFLRIYDKVKLRNKEYLSSQFVLHLFSEGSRMLSVSKDLSQVHHFNMTQMIHPHWGYLCRFDKHEFPLKQIMEFIKVEMVSSRFREEKLPLMANKISAFNYWSIIDKKLEGNINIEDFAYLLSACKINNICNGNHFNSEEEINKYSSINVYNTKENGIRLTQNSLPTYQIFEYLFMENCMLV